MSESISDSHDRGRPWPEPPAALFLVGLGGIGMSGLAQLLRWRGYAVAGSDRELTGVGRDDLYAKLNAQGIRLFPQDGSGVRATCPAAVIVSAAVEADNPDLAAATALGTATFGRAVALAAAIDALPLRQIAVAGSCGKTTVTAWLTSALHALGVPLLSVCGGYMNDVISATAPGNFYADANPAIAVLEVDESDGSLVAFHPHTAVVLNLGRDHFEEAKLRSLFATFSSQATACVVLNQELAAALPTPGKQRFLIAAGAGLADGQDQPPASVATGATQEGLLWAALVHQSREGMTFHLNGVCQLTVPQYGWHSVSNALAVAAALWCVEPEFSLPEISRALTPFRGVHRRFQCVGSLGGRVPVYDDYAHNVEKIAAAMRAAQAIWSSSPVLFVWQPHGYGPLGFMRDALQAVLARTLRQPLGDRLLLLPVYYAGGTTSFVPTAAEVAAGYEAAGLPVAASAGREQATDWVREHAPDFAAVVVMGARDPGLHAWVCSLATG